MRHSVSVLNMQCSGVCGIPLYQDRQDDFG